MKEIVILIWFTVLFLGYETWEWTKRTFDEGARCDTLAKQCFPKEIEKTQERLRPNIDVIIGALKVIVVLNFTIVPGLTMAGELGMEAMIWWAILNTTLFLAFIGLLKFTEYVMKKLVIEDAIAKYQFLSDLRQLKKEAEELEAMIKDRKGE